MTGTIYAHFVPETGQLVSICGWRWVVVAGAAMSDEPSREVLPLVNQAYVRRSRQWPGLSRGNACDSRS
jgi:hypothetical protein